MLDFTEALFWQQQQRQQQQQQQQHLLKIETTGIHFTVTKSRSETISVPLD